MFSFKEKKEKTGYHLLLASQGVSTLEYWVKKLINEPEEQEIFINQLRSWFEAFKKYVEKTKKTNL